jgi:signal transduction histidine kinase/tetratricopeptide (TPR) repeat protein
MQVQPATTEVPQLVGGRYRVLALRGSGAEASVYLATDLFTGREVALKLGSPERLATEYRRCASLSHPHLARAIALWHGAGSASLALEYGAEDLSALRGRGEELVVRHVAEIARALGYLHRSGIVHADLKPQNAVLAGSPGSRRALLVDLGFAGVKPSARGSLEYAAPEVLEGAAPDVASDLYSLGVTLYELLAGNNPFAAATPVEAIRARFESIPPARASPGVQAVISKLLAREPRSRYAAADEVIEALAAATGLPLEMEGEGLSPDRIALGGFYGRDAELARLEAAGRRAGQGNGAQILVLGPRGSGRSRLLAEAKPALELAGLRVLHVEGGQGIAALCRWLGEMLGLAPLFEASVGAAWERLAAACAQHPVALLLDDAERIPDGLAALLLALARDARWKEKALLLVAASTQLLDAQMERIDLRPLAPAAAAAKLVEALGPRPWAEGLASAVVRETSGHPRELEEALRDLAARGLLERRGGRWELDLLRAGPDFSGCVPRTSTRAAREKVRALAAPERARLGLVAVLWPQLDGSALAEPESADVVEGIRVAEQVGLSLSRLAVLRAAGSALSTAERRRIHLKAAQLARDAAVRAHHLFRAGARGRVRAALAVARERLRSGAPLAAAFLYQLARAGLRQPLLNRRAALLCERAGDCLALAGQPAAARLEYGRALARGGNAGRIWQKVAKARWQEGRFDLVLDALVQARAGGADPLAVATVEARAEAMRGNYPRAQDLAARALPLARQRGDADAASRLHHLLGTCAWHRGEGHKAAVEERAAVLIARRQGDLRAEADALTGLGTAYRLLARYDRSADKTQRALDLYRILGDERQEAIAWNNLGVTRYLAGEWDRALEAWEKLGEKQGRTLEEELLTLNNLGFLYSERGDTPRAREMFRRALTRIERAGGHARIEAMVRGNLGDIAAREADPAAAAALYRQARAIAERIGARDELVETERRLAELDLLLRDPVAARVRATEALRLAIESGNLVEQGNLYRVLALAARAKADGAAAAAAVKAARECLEGAGAPLALARIDCVACLVELDRGEPVQAGALLRRARGVFEKLGAAPELREVERLEKDVEALQRKSFSHVEALTQAAQRLAAKGDHAALLEEALDEALLLTGAERGFILLAEGEGEPRPVAVRGTDSRSALRISRSVADRVLRTGEVVAVADIVACEELSNRKSILDLGLRSVLCAPIRSGGRQLGVLYVDSRRVGSLLSERDLGLLNAFAALVGSALESARLIEDLRRKGELLAHMAHELRQPLLAIKAYADLTRQEPGMARQVRDGLEVVASQSAKLSKMIDRTLELARMEAGAVNLTRAKVDLTDVAAAAISRLRPLAAMKSIEVDLAADAGLPAVLGDFDRLVQVVTNLIGNAVHYSETGTRVSVRLAAGDPLPPAKPAARIEVEGAAPEPSSEPAPAGSARVVVADQGPGLSPQDLPHLFTPFFRNGNESGIGLGLVISRQIVRQHGGDICVESQPGHGTTFTVVLPGAP